MTIKQKLDRLVQAVASYERTDVQLQHFPATGYFRRHEPGVEEARVPYRDALGEARDKAALEIKEVRADLEGTEAQARAQVRRIRQAAITRVTLGDFPYVVAYDDPGTSQIARFAARGDAYRFGQARAEIERGPGAHRDIVVYHVRTKHVVKLFRGAPRTERERVQDARALAVSLQMETEDVPTIHATDEWSETRGYILSVLDMLDEVEARIRTCEAQEDASTE